MEMEKLAQVRKTMTQFLFQRVFNIQYKITLDVNECTLGLDTCEQTCTNDICSRNNQDFDYTCSCDEGYNLNTSNLMTCEGKICNYHQLLSLSRFVYYRYK